MRSLSRLDFSLLSVVVLAASTAAADPAKQSLIAVGKPTTHISKPLDKQGFVDYLGALNRLQSRGVVTRSNYEVVLRNVMGPAAILAADRAQYYRQLGLAIPRKKQDWFVGYLAFAAREKAPPAKQEALYNEFSRLLQRPWKAPQHPLAAKWLRAVDHHLEEKIESR